MSNRMVMIILLIGGLIKKAWYKLVNSAVII